MKKLITLFFLLIFLTCTYSQTYKQVKIYLNNNTDIQVLNNAGLEIDHAYFTKDGAAEVFLDEQEFAILQTLGFRYEVLIEDWQEYYDALPQLADAEKQSLLDQSKEMYNVDGFEFGSMGGFYTYAQMVVELDSMFMLYPNLITQKIPIGTTVEGRTIWGVKISDNPNSSENEPRVAFTGVTHAREPMGMMNLMYYMYYLLENYGINPEVTYLVNNREIFFVPIVNPDGYEYNRSINPNGGGMWRKNRRNNGGSYGVDLNRNYGPYAYWNAPNGGSSTNPSDDTYRGTAPFSEPETQAVRDFIAGKSIKTALNYHTYGNLLIYPYGALGHETPDSIIFREYAGDMTQYNNYTAGTDLQTVNYSTRGNSDDYMYDGDTVLNAGKIFAMTPEVGTVGFWEPQGQILARVQECLWMNKYYTWVAGGYLDLQDPNYELPYMLPGDTLAIQPIYFNKGRGGSSPATVELTSLSSYATVFANSAPLDSIPARSSQMTFMPCGLFLSPATPIEQEIKLVLALRTGSTYLRRDTISFIVGMPTFVMADTTNNINTLWTITSTPVNPKWAVTTTTFHSAPNSYTDSPTGNYSNNATVVMTLTNSINLSTYQHPRLTYWTRFDFETGWDYGQVEISTNNGTTWIPMAGGYTTLGSGSFQPPGQPLYDGTLTTWVREEIDLTAYNSSQFKVRFELKSDGSQVRDGWYLDDIGVMIYAAVPVELTSFTADTKDGSVVLNWATSTELNNNGFEVERAQADDKGNIINKYSSLGFVKGNGTSSVKNNYRFVDNNPLTGTSVYRLKQLDFDGTVRVYGPIEVVNEPVYSYELAQNYPNPFNPSTTIKYSLAENSFVSIEIYNIIGQKIASLVNTKQEAGSYSVSFNAGEYNLSNGVYIYKLRTDNFTSNRKMILMK
jgi:murein tripeptide amidase MpaA